jgi:hypothetical protein
MKFFTQLCVVILALTIITGCASASYKGRYNQETPVEERCLFEIGYGLTLVKINDEETKLSSGYAITISNGQYDLIFDFEISKSRVTDINRGSAYITTTYDVTTTSAKGLVYTGEFIAGHHYVFEPDIYSDGNKKYVIIKVTDQGTNTSSFKDGVYSGSDVNIGWWLGMTPTTFLSAGFNYSPLYYVHDGASRWNIYIDVGADIGLPGKGIDVGITSGVLAELFLFNTTSSIAMGTGIRWSPYLGQYQGSDYDKLELGEGFAPYLRGEFKFPRTGWRLFFDCYFLKPASNFNENDALLFRNWGIGLQKRM